MRGNASDIISVIIVHYKVKNLLLKCLESLYAAEKQKFEVIVVDNDEHKTIQHALLSKFPEVKYIKNKNRGFGQGNNIGVKHASGKYLFFLNPDTVVKPDSLKNLYDFLQKNKNVAVVAPLLLDADQKPYALQGTMTLTPLRALISLSFINKLFPKNGVSKNYWQIGWDKTKKKEVEAVPGTAFMIARSLFEKVGGFDEKFFLYFEEHDLFKRVKDAGYKLYILPSASVIHFWGESTKKSNKNIKKIFNASRFYYFRKHYGILAATLVSLGLSINFRATILVFIITVYILLTTLHINELMTFIGDQAWFYNSARSIYLYGNIPLVGIASSHPWLHQGPLWTYMLAPVLFLFNGDPVSGVILSAGFGLATILLAYKFGREYFLNKLALLFAILFATSPLIIYHARMPYHTSPIPFFILLLIYSITKWAQGNKYYLPLTLFVMSILYNLHLGTVIFWPVIILIFAYGLFKKEKYMQYARSRKMLIISLIAIMIPMIPVFIYDVNNGFPQTVKYAGWYIYKLLQLFGIFERSLIDNTSYLVTADFFIEKYSTLTFNSGKLVGVSLFLVTMAVAIIEFKKNKITHPFNILFLTTSVGLISFFASNVPSEAYFVLLSVGLIFLFSFAISKLSGAYMVVLVAFILFINIYSLISTDFLMFDGLTMAKRKEAAEKVIELTSDQRYNLLFRGEGEEFESSRANYEYLIWWLNGTMPSKNSENLKITIEEARTKIIVKKVD